MTKAEIIEAIEATIRPNGEKAITAESLANLLIEMANATPEGGGGSGVLSIQVGEAEDGSDLTEEQLANNVAVYNKVTETEGNVPIFIFGQPLAYMSTHPDDQSHLLEYPYIYATDTESSTLLGIIVSVYLHPDGRVAITA